MKIVKTKLQKLYNKFINSFISYTIYVLMVCKADCHISKYLMILPNLRVSILK